MPGRGHDVVIFGGEDHKTGQVEDTNKCYEAVQRRLESLLPGIEIVHRWSGQVIETPDGLPYLGRTAEHQYGDRLCGQRHDVRHAGRDDRCGCHRGATESVGGPVRT